MFKVVDGYVGKYVKYDGDLTGLRKIEAMRKSVKKWEFIAEWCESHDDSEFLADGGENTCALCKLYLGETDRECVGCPILDRTGKIGCQETPYVNYRRSGGDSRVARREVAFLKTLLRIEESDLFEVEYEDGDARLGLKRDFGNADPLAESIEKWEVIVAICSDPTFKGKVLNADAGTCGLCNEHAYCDDCPVRDSTGRLGCAGTPWSDFWRANDVMNREGVLKAAKAEVEFLKGLRAKPQLIITGVIDQTIYFEVDDYNIRTWIRKVCDPFADVYHLSREPRFLTVKVFVKARELADWLVINAKEAGLTAEVRDA